MFKLHLLIITGLLAVAGCKEKNYAITDINKIPVIIEFTIPKNEVVNNRANAKKEDHIRLKVLKQYPELSNLRLQLHSNISTIEYYEYAAELSEEKVIVFVFESNDNITIGALKSKTVTGLESRYEIADDGLTIYKRRLSINKSVYTVSVFYRFRDKSISFCSDDSFSKW